MQQALVDLEQQKLFRHISNDHANHTPLFHGVIESVVRRVRLPGGSYIKAEMEASHTWRGSRHIAVHHDLRKRERDTGTSNQG